MSGPSFPYGAAMVDANGMPTREFYKFLSQLTSGSTSVMPTPAPVIIKADYTGAILANQLPYMVKVVRYQNGVDVSGHSTWSLAVSSGTITATINTVGTITITAITGSAILQVRSTFNGVSLYCNVTVNVSIAAPPSTGSSGGSSGSTTTISSTSSASYGSANTSDLSVVVGSSGTVNLSAPLTVDTFAGSPNGTFAVWGKWQWYNGTSWVDVAAEVTSNPHCSVKKETQDTVPPTTIYTENSGTLTVNTSQSGLTAGSTQKFHLLLRNDSTTGTRTMTYSGTASAVPQ